MKSKIVAFHLDHWRIVRMSPRGHASVPPTPFKPNSRAIHTAKKLPNRFGIRPLRRDVHAPPVRMRARHSDNLVTTCPFSSCSPISSSSSFSPCSRSSRTVPNNPVPFDPAPFVTVPFGAGRSGSTGGSLSGIDNPEICRSGESGACCSRSSESLVFNRSGGDDVGGSPDVVEVSFETG